MPKNPLGRTPRFYNAVSVPDPVGWLQRAIDGKLEVLSSTLHSRLPKNGRNESFTPIRYYHGSVRVRGLLVDLDGTLYTYEGPVRGANEALKRLDRAGIDLRFVTNATHKPRREIAAHLENLGFLAKENHIFTPATAVAERL